MVSGLEHNMAGDMHYSSVTLPCCIHLDDEANMREMVECVLTTIKPPCFYFTKLDTPPPLLFFNDLSHARASIVTLGAARGSVSSRPHPPFLHLSACSCAGSVRSVRVARAASAAQRLRSCGGATRRCGTDTRCGHALFSFHLLCVSLFPVCTTTRVTFLISH